MERLQNHTQTRLQHEVNHHAHPLLLYDKTHTDSSVERKSAKPSVQINRTAAREGRRTQ